MQVEKRLVTEVRLGTCVADKQDFRHRVKVEKEVICLLISLLIALEQVNLHLSRIDHLLPTPGSLFSLIVLFTLLDVLHIQSNSLAELKEGFRHVICHFVDNDPADYHVDGKINYLT